MLPKASQEDDQKPGTNWRLSCARRDTLSEGFFPSGLVWPVRWTDGYVSRPGCN